MGLKKNKMPGLTGQNACATIDYIKNGLCLHSMQGICCWRCGCSRRVFCLVGDKEWKEPRCMRQSKYFALVMR